MSVKKLIYKTIGNYLMKTLKKYDPNAPEGEKGNAAFPDHLPNLKWSDKQMGQFTNSEQSYALPLPAILMEFGSFAWSTTGTSQKGEGIIRFYIYYENYADSFSGSINQETALNFWEFTEQVHIALQGLSIANVLSPLERVTDVEDIEQDMIITSVVEYSCIIYDDSTQKKVIDVDPDVKANYSKKSSRPPESEEPTFYIGPNKLSRNKVVIPTSEL